MGKLFLKTVKEYCRVLGLCYTALIGFTLFLALTLSVDHVPYQEVLTICFEFLSISIIVAVFVVTPVFVTIFLVERKKRQRKK